MVHCAWLPILVALSAAFFFGMAGLTSKKGMTHIEPQVAVVISLGASFVGFTLTAPLWMRSDDWFSAGFWVFVINGLMHPLLSTYFWMEAIQRAGATVASTLTATAPLFGAATAVLFLGERMELLLALGIVTTICGVITLSYGPMGVTQVMKIALLFATGAAVVRGLNHTVGRFGMELMPNPMMAAFISSGVAFAGALSLFRLRHGSLPRRVAPAGVPFMCLTGVLTAAGISSMYYALSMGEVVVVSPLIATYPLFTLVGALMLSMERFSIRVGIGVTLVVAGVIAISSGRV